MDHYGAQAAHWIDYTEEAELRAELKRTRRKPLPPGTSLETLRETLYTWLKADEEGLRLARFCHRHGLPNIDPYSDEFLTRDVND